VKKSFFCQIEPSAGEEGVERHIPMIHKQLSILCKPRMLFAAMSVLLMTAVGCVRFTQPILKDEQVSVDVDKDILGKWVTDDGDKEAIEILPPRGDDKNYEVHYKDKEGKEGTFLVRFGKIQNTMVAEIHGGDFAPDSSETYKSHFLPLYSFLIIYQTKPNLIVSSMDSDWLGKYLDAHPNELKLIDKDSMVVTSSTEDVQKFILKHQGDEKAMGEKGTLVRPGDPTTRAAAK
jgi:hypothetical protein